MSEQSAVCTFFSLLHRLELPYIHAYWLFGSRGSDIRLQTYTRLLEFGLRPSHTRLKRYTPIVFLRFYFFFFSSTGPRAARAENFESTSYTRFLLSELAT